MISIICPHCSLTSYNPHDVIHRYCAHCNTFEGDQHPVHALIYADLTDAEYLEVVKLLRHLDNARPNAKIQITTLAPDGSIAEGLTKMRQALPEEARRETEIRVYKREE